jgi:hypothetical protein
VTETLDKAEAHFRDTQEGGEIPASVAAAFRAIRENPMAALARAGAESRHETSAAVDKALEDDETPITELPIDLARAWIDHQEARPFLTLKDAKLIRQGIGGADDLGTIRVAVAQIAAWWPIAATGTTYTPPDGS